MAVVLSVLTLLTLPSVTVVVLAFSTVCVAADEDWYFFLSDEYFGAPFSVFSITATLPPSSSGCARPPVGTPSTSA